MPRSLRGFTLIFVAAWLVIGILIFSMTMNSTTSVSAVEAKGVGVYWNNNCTNGVSSIDWGTLNPGSVKNTAVYIRNEVEEPVYLILSTTNWNPPKAFEYLKLRWDYNQGRMNPSEVLQITLTLSVSSYIEGISSFSFDILVTASDHLLGDVNGDGRISIADLITMDLAFNGVIVEPRADLNSDGRISVADLKMMDNIYSGINS